MRRLNLISRSQHLIPVTSKLSHFDHAADDLRSPRAWQLAFSAGLSLSRFEEFDTGPGPGQYRVSLKSTEPFRESHDMSATRAHNIVHRVAINAAIGISLLTGCGCSGFPTDRPRLLTAEVAGPVLRGTRERSDGDLSEQWNEWGSQHLENGDIIFILGHSRLLMGLIDFSKFSSEIAASRFSHVGIISIEQGRPYVYDTVSGGPRRKELGWYLARDEIRRVAIQRPRPEFARHTPDVIRFCRDAYSNQIPFDERFRVGDDRYSCAEFVEVAWRRQGVPLCEPIPINQLPNFAAVPAATVIMVEALTSISREQPIVLPGNESFGIWSSPALQVLLPEQSPQQVPRGIEKCTVRRLDSGTDRSSRQI